MSNITRFIKSFMADDQGLETVEYAIIGGLIVAATIVTIVAIGMWVNTKFDSLNTTLQGH